MAEIIDFFTRRAQHRRKPIADELRKMAQHIENGEINPHAFFIAFFDNTNRHGNVIVHEMNLDEGMANTLAQFLEGAF